MNHRIILTIFFLSLAALLSAGPIAISPASPAPGTVVMVQENSRLFLESCLLVDTRNDSVVLHSVPFYLEQGRAMFLVPLCHTLEPGEYALVLYDSRGHSYRLTLTVASREFNSMDIALNTAMSTLRTTVNARREQESARLWRLLGTRDFTLAVRRLRFVKPVGESRVSARFGDRRRFIYSDGSTATAYHHGIDYAVPIGTPVLAVESGRVVMASDRLITGYTIIIEHLPGVFTMYYHLDRLDVGEGDGVLKGNQIGVSGATGLATGPHLHFEMRVFQVPVDPDLFMVNVPEVDSGIDSSIPPQGSS